MKQQSRSTKHLIDSKNLTMPRKKTLYGVFFTQEELTHTTQGNALKTQNRSSSNSSFYNTDANRSLPSLAKVNIDNLSTAGQTQAHNYSIIQSQINNCSLLSKIQTSSQSILGPKPQNRYDNGLNIHKQKNIHINENLQRVAKISSKKRAEIISFIKDKKTEHKKKLEKFAYLTQSNDTGV